MQVSTANDFTGTISSTNTVLTNATVSVPALSINTTYYGRVNSIITGSSSPYSSYVTTATLRGDSNDSRQYMDGVHDIIDGHVAQWKWEPIEHNHQVELSTVSGFASGITFSSTTNNLNGTFISLDPGATYFAQVRALNHSDIPTAYLVLGSTFTTAASLPTNLFVTTSTENSLTASWTPPTPPGDSYTLQVSTDNTFDPTVTFSSNTVLSNATIGSLSINTTYYAHVNAIISGSSSPWTAFVTTSTLANMPATAVSTWTVNTTSVTVAFTQNGNPSNVTKSQSNFRRTIRSPR